MTLPPAGAAHPWYDTTGQNRVAGSKAPRVVHCLAHGVPRPDKATGAVMKEKAPTGQRGPADHSRRDGPVLWTVGHGNRTAQDLITLLAEHQIRHLVDVRRYPASRRNPHFGRGPLQAELSFHQVRYQWCGEALGGRREPVSGSQRHPAWTDVTFRGYADHMDRTEFRSAFSQLLIEAQQSPTALMCAETLWWRCHRRLLGDAACLAGIPVVHMVSPGLAQPHRLHPGVRRGDDGWPVYDIGVQPELG